MNHCRQKWAADRAMRVLLPATTMEVPILMVAIIVAAAQTQARQATMTAEALEVGTRVDAIAIPLTE